MRIEQLSFGATAPFLLPLGMLYYEKTEKDGFLMANCGKYYIAVRLLLLKQYLEAYAGRKRISWETDPHFHHKKALKTQK